MKIERQVTSLELSKKLKELVIEQESLFYWSRIEYNPKIVYKETPSEISGDFRISAFTVSELLEILPKRIEDKCIKIISTLNNNYLIGYPDILYKIPGKSYEDKNLSNALAEMIIYLIENKLMDIK